MANVHAIKAVGRSLARYLNQAYDQSGLVEECKFQLVSSSDLKDNDLPEGLRAENVVSLFLYRASVNAHLRSSGRVFASDASAPPLSLDLHYLFSLWSESADAEHTLLAWTMRELHQHPVLDASTLLPDARWGSDEVVQMIPAELSTEDLMRIWDAVTPSYRLSVSYIARVVRIDPARPVEATGAPVVATRFSHGERERPAP